MQTLGIILFAAQPDPTCTPQPGPACLSYFILGPVPCRTALNCENSSCFSLFVHSCLVPEGSLVQLLSLDGPEFSFV